MNSNKFICSALVLASMLLSACGGGGGGGSAPTAPTDANPVATAVKSSAPITNCPNGGITVDAGIDSNGNNVLDLSEVTSTQYVCNGASGTNGLAMLVLISNEATGINCAAGGKKVSAGQDTNSNGLLDNTEVTSTAYLCNGAAGTNGNPGVDGGNGLNSLVAIVPEAAGAFCTYGGNKVSNGVDSNVNNILDPSEISASSYVCNGAPGTPGSTGPAGPGITWVNVTGTTQQAASNTGYMANNAAQVTITLPVAPVLGDVVSVSGIGAGGWKIAQNAGQTIITKGISGSIGAVWTPRDAMRNWFAVASSADGSKLVAADWGGQLYTSADSGMTWLPREGVRKWTSVATSSDGTKLVAVANGAGIYTSTDSGLTWAARGAALAWQSVASSADGVKLVAVVPGGQIYTSTDSGVTWTPRDAVRSWSGVASSADGSKLVAADQAGQLYASNDSGLTWTARGAVLVWKQVASSADGSKLVAAAWGDRLYTSADSGVTWLPREGVRNWYGVASSEDGSKLVASSYGGQLFTSTDSGVTWLPREGVRNWYGVASSADGSKLVAAAFLGGRLYTSNTYTTPGITGSISGNQYDSLDLQCVDANTFMVRGYVGNLLMQ